MKVRPFLIIILLTVIKPNAFSQDGKWSSHPDTAIFKYYTARQISVDLLQQKAPHKFILVYYYEHYSIRVNNFNKIVLGDTAVVNYILSNFYPICVDLDIDKIGPEDQDKDRSRVYRKFLSEQAYYVKVTPAFSIYNPSGELKGTKTFINAKKESIQEFLDWMKKRLIE